MGELKRDWLGDYPLRLRQALADLARSRREDLFIAGGAVREWLAGRLCHDLDLTVARDAMGWARALARDLGAAFVPLDEEQGVARVVWQGLEIDFCQFRGGAKNLEEDLGLRDFTINAMAVSFAPDSAGLLPPYEILDPTGGRGDFQDHIVRATSDEIFVDDPLRLLRAYRFVAALDFTLESQTLKIIQRDAALITNCAGERIAYETARIMRSAQSHKVFVAMASSGLLQELFPELFAGLGVMQPASHHLDVFSHNLEALARMERLQTEPDRYFPGHGPQMAEYLAQSNKRMLLKWAALFHDLGKPQTLGEKQGRSTFYQHEQAGARQVVVIAARLGWSRANTDMVCSLIRLHMRPFHLNNVLRSDGQVTARACLRLVKAIGDDLPGLFLLAMADSLAGQGPEKPPDMEVALAGLYNDVEAIYREYIQPVLSAERLVDGHDLQKEFKLAPGPLFSRIFEGLQEAQVMGEVSSRQEALAWVGVFISEQERDF